MFQKSILEIQIFKIKVFKAFSFEFTDDRLPINFIAENHTEQMWWVDAISCLLFEENFRPSTDFDVSIGFIQTNSHYVFKSVSKFIFEFQDDVEKLLRLKLKVQMIEFQDMDIPESLPSIDDLSPPPPEWLELSS